MKELADLAIRLVGSGRHRPGPLSNQSFSLYTKIDRAKAGPPIYCPNWH